MKVHTYIVLFSFLLMSFGVQAATVFADSTLKSDTVRITSLKATQIKTVEKKIELIHDSLTIKPFKPNPLKVVWMGAIIPGYGQIMNKKYWKLPLVYGGFLGCAYFITWNSSHYESYKNAYRDIISNDPTATSYLEILPKGITSIDDPNIGGKAVFTNTLKNKQDAFRRYRDLSIIITIGVYALSVVDAYVDAQLYDFDISPNLSFRFQPTLLENAYGARNTLGMQCCFSLK